MRPCKMVGTLCLLLAFASTDLWAQGEVVFSDWDWAVRSAQVIRRYATDTDSLVAARHWRAQDRLQLKQYIRIGEVVHRLSPNASGREVSAAVQRMDSLRCSLQSDADFATAGGEVRWTRLTEELQECIDVLAALPKDSVSQPFVSPLGVHLVKWTDCLPEEPASESQRRLEAWADRRDAHRYPFHTQLDSLCALYPAAEAELRALYQRMIKEYSGESEDDNLLITHKHPTKAEKKAAKQAEKERRKAEKQAAKEAKKRKKIVKKQ